MNGYFHGKQLDCFHFAFLSNHIIFKAKICSLRNTFFLLLKVDLASEGFLHSKEACNPENSFPLMKWQKKTWKYIFLPHLHLSKQRVADNVWKVNRVKIMVSAPYIIIV